MRFLTLLGMVLFAACGTVEEGYVMPRPVTVEIRNEYRSDVRVWIVSDSGERRRVAFVTAYGGRRSITIPTHMVGRPVRFWIEPMGEDGHMSESVVVPQGRTGRLEVATTRNGSFLSVW